MAREEYERKKQSKNKSVRQHLVSFVGALNAICCEASPEEIKMHRRYFDDSVLRANQTYAQKMKSGPGFNPFKHMSIPEYVVKRGINDSETQDAHDPDAFTRKTSGFRAPDMEFPRSSEKSRSRSRSDHSREGQDDLADLVKTYNESSPDVGRCRAEASENKDHQQRSEGSELQAGRFNSLASHAVETMGSSSHER
jgi:hypothetical protein